MNSVKLHIGEQEVLSTELTYEQLVLLYQQYTELHGKSPTANECTAKNNLPQMRIVQRVIADAGVTYKDFMRQFGKYSKVRTESKDFDTYLRRYHEVAAELGHAPTGSELINNPYGLPGELWFIKNCPDHSVKTYDQFVEWCGYKSNRLKRNEADIANALIELEKNLGRPLRTSDIKKATVGFSMIVVSRIYGGLNEAKEALGLMPTPPQPPKPFEYYRDALNGIVTTFMHKTGRDRITWRDIESGQYSNKKINHKTYYKAFGDAGVNIFAYIKTLGCDMRDSSFGYTYTFDDGERVRSSMEYDFTLYLRSLGYRYGVDYLRDVMYRKYTDIDSRIDCDYVINLNGCTVFVEIAGVIFNPCKTDFAEYDYGAERQNTYRDKMKLKRRVLEEMGASYLFLFSNDMENGRYIEIFNNYIQRMNTAA